LALTTMSPVSKSTKSVGAHVMDIVMYNVLKEHDASMTHGSNFHLSTKLEYVMLSSGRIFSVYVLWEVQRTFAKHTKTAQYYTVMLTSSKLIYSSQAWQTIVKIFSELVLQNYIELTYSSTILQTLGKLYISSEIAKLHITPTTHLKTAG